MAYKDKNKSKEYQREWHKRNKKRRMKKKKERGDFIREWVKNYVNEIGCYKCKNIPKKISYREREISCNISALVKRQLKIQRYKEIIDSADLLCLECFRKEIYETNKKKKLLSTQERKKFIREWVREYVNKLKCSSCKTENPTFIFFTHENGEEIKSSITKLISYLWKIDKFQKIIDKSELLCNFCFKKENRNLKKFNIRKQKYKEIKKTCESCSIVFVAPERNKTLLCQECFKCWQSKNIFEKLCITEKNLQKANQMATEILSNHYFEEKMSMPDLSAKYSLNLNTIRRFFNKNNIKTRNLSQSVSNALEQGKFCKSIHHYTWFGDEACLKSSYEKRIAEELDRRTEYYKYESLRIAYEFENVLRTYVPDFYIPKYNLIIEGKSRHIAEVFGQDNMKEKTLGAQKEGYKIIIMYDKEIKEFENGKKLETYCKIVENAPCSI